jgi:hypothetical protein
LPPWAERKQVSDEMQKVYRLFVSDKISDDGFALQYRPLEERLKQIQDELPRLQGEVDFKTIQLLSGDQILSEAKDSILVVEPGRIRRRRLPIVSSEPDSPA